MTYRVIALDLDGTLLTGQKQILPASLAALEQARQQGIMVLLVTGRHHVAIRPFYDALQLDTPALCCNGSYIYDVKKQRVLSSSPLRKEQAKQLLQLIAPYKPFIMGYISESMIYQQHSPHAENMLAWSQRLPPQLRPVIHQVADLQSAIQAAPEIWKFGITHSDHQALRNMCELVEKELGLSSEWSWVDQVDIAQTGNNKGQQLAQWLSSQGIDMSEVIAFGDNFNDLAMLKMAGLGVAMGNSVAELKAVADLVIEDNEMPSIARTLHEHVLGLKYT